jgi:hypothetical protein
MKPITDIAIVPRQPRWPVRLDPVAPPSLRKVVRDTAPSTTEPTMEPHPITDMECHPLADIFPMISEEDLTFLAEDIKANGLLTPIVTFENKVLDGRNRLKACQMAGVDPVFKDFEGDDPITFVISANLHRRHLTTPQRKQVAAEILKRQPERSNRSVAAEVELDAKTVAEVRKDAEACEEIPHIGPTERIDAAAATGLAKPSTSRRRRPSRSRSRPSRNPGLQSSRRW